MVEDERGRVVIHCLEVPYKFVWLWVGVESEFSDRLWLELSLGQAEQNK